MLLYADKQQALTKQKTFSAYNREGDIYSIGGAEGATVVVTVGSAEATAPVSSREGAEGASTGYP